MKLSIYNDQSGALSFDEIKVREFKPTTVDYLASELSASTYWVLVEIDGLSQNQLIASSCYMQLDFLTAVIHEGSGWRESKTGDRRPFSQQQVKHHCFAFDLSASDTDSFYLKAHGQGFVRLPLVVESKAEFWERGQATQLWAIFCFAFLFSMFVYNLFLYFIIGEKGYLYYVGYLGSVTLFLMTISGHAPLYLWPNSPSWTNLSSLYLATIALFFGLHFLRDMTNIDKLMPTLGNSMKMFSFAGVAVFLINPISIAASFYVLGTYVALSLLLITLAITVSIRKGWVPSYFLLLSPIIMVPAVLAYYGRFMGWIENGWFIENIMLMTSLAESVLLSFVLAYRIRRMNLEIDAHQKQANRAQRNLSQSLLNAADQERRAIARELHDNFGQGMLVVKSLLNRFETHPNALQAKSQLGSLISDMRNMARRMHPQQIESLGFVTALETMLIDTIESAGINLELDLSQHDCAISKNTELHLYRIMQECSANIVKHAKATHVRACMEFKDNHVFLSISDNGIGISEVSTQGLGILNMRERADIVEANILFTNLLPQGTKIEIEVQDKHTNCR